MAEQGRPSPLVIGAMIEYVDVGANVHLIGQLCGLGRQGNGFVELAIRRPGDWALSSYLALEDDLRANRYRVAAEAQRRWESLVRQEVQS